MMPSAPNRLDCEKAQTAKHSEPQRESCRRYGQELGVEIPGKRIPQGSGQAPIPVPLSRRAAWSACSDRASGGRLPHLLPATPPTAERGLGRPCAARPSLVAGTLVANAAI